MKKAFFLTQLILITACGVEELVPLPESLSTPDPVEQVVAPDNPPEEEILDTLVLDDVTFGHATVEGDDNPYFFVGGTLTTADDLKVLSFKEDSCVLFATSGEQFSEYWISLLSWSAGLMVDQTAPISQRTLAVATESGGSGEASTDWNTLKVSGPDGRINYVVKADGFVKLSFLWPVPDDFKPARVRIGSLGEMNLDN